MLTTMQAAEGATAQQHNSRQALRPGSVLKDDDSAAQSALTLGGGELLHVDMFADNKSGIDY
jgi:hypothetical protein